MHFQLGILMAWSWQLSYLCDWQLLNTHIGLNMGHVIYQQKPYSANGTKRSSANNQFQPQSGYYNDDISTESTPSSHSRIHASSASTTRVRRRAAISEAHCAVFGRHAAQCPLVIAPYANHYRIHTVFAFTNSCIPSLDNSRP